MKISDQKKEKIAEQILAYLFSVSPKVMFTSEIAKEIARDEEFVKKILLLLKKRKFVREVKKNNKGLVYIRRIRWGLSDSAYKAYKKLQN